MKNRIIIPKRKLPDFYLLLKQLPSEGNPPRYFFNHVATRPSYEKRRKSIEILGVIDPSPDFVGGRLVQGKQKAIAICNQLNARVGRIRLPELGGHQTTGSANPPSSRETATLLEKRTKENGN